MANEYTITISIEADGKLAVKGINEVADATTNMSKKSGGVLSMLKENWIGLSVGINQAMELVGKIMDMAQKMIAFGEAGAAVERTERGFNAAAEAAGYMGEQVASGLKAASGAMMDATDIMQRGGRLMQEGLDPKMLEEIMGLLRQQAPVVGDTLAGAWDKFSMSMSRGALRGMRQYIGLVDLNKAYEKYASSIGTTSAMLTEDTKMQVLASTVRDKLIDQTKDMRKNQESYAESMQISKVVIKESWETMQKAAQPYADLLLRMTASVMQFAAAATPPAGTMEKFYELNLPPEIARAEALKKQNEAAQKGFDDYEAMQARSMRREVEVNQKKTRELTETEQESFRSRLISSNDLYNAKFAQIDEEYKKLLRTTGGDKEATDNLNKWKTNEIAKAQRAIILSEMAAHGKYLSLIGEEVSVIENRYATEVINAKGNAIILIELEKSKNIEFAKLSMERRDAWNKLEDDRVKATIERETKIAQAQAGAGLISEEEAAKIESDNAVKLLALEKERLQTRLVENQSVLTDKERRDLSIQILDLENKIYNSRLQSDTLAVIATEKQRRAIEKTNRDFNEKILKQRVDFEDKFNTYQYKQLKIAEEKVVKAKYTGERDVLQAKMDSLDIDIKNEPNLEKQVTLISQFGELQDQYNKSLEYEVFDLQEKRLDAMNRFVDIMDQISTQQREGIVGTFTEMNNLLSFTTQSTDKLLQTLSTGMQQVIASGQGAVAVLTGTDTYEKQFQAQAAAYLKLEELAAQHHEFEAAAANAQAQLMVSLEEKKFQQQASLYSSGFGTLAGLALSFYAASGKQSRAALAVYQGMSVAQAIIDTYASATLAYKRGLEIPLVGPYIAPALAAIAVAAGMARVAAIKAQTFHAGGTVGGNGGDVATVLQKREVVIDKNTADKAGGYAGVMNKLNEPSKQQPPQDISIINVMDNSVMESYMMSPKGRRVIRNIMQSK